MACKHCDYMILDDRSGYKCYCEWYRHYFDPDDTSCSHFKARNSGCFLTSACVQHKGLSDDCYELETLREFRDKTFKTMPQGKEMISFYYQEAPRIVKQIDASDRCAELYDWIYETIADTIIPLIQEKAYERVVTNYLYMMYKADLASREEKKHD